VIKKPIRWWVVLVHVAAWLPLALTAWSLWRGTLSADPIRAVTLRTGRVTVVLLGLSLACTPAAMLTGYRPVRRLRKPLGLYAALYAVLHLAVFVVWDYGLQFDLIWYELSAKRFLQVGLPAVLILAALAITSTRGWMRRLGRGWRWLHRSVYLAALLAALHYLWAVKADRRAPLAYATVVVALLVMRAPAIERAIRRLRSGAS
jgi:methionine sulfoxide reductase heme-binding subunit